MLHKAFVDAMSNDELFDWACRARDDLGLMYSALKTIVNSEEHHGETVVCDFSSLQSVARACLSAYQGEQP